MHKNKETRLMQVPSPLSLPLLLPLALLALPLALPALSLPLPLALALPLPVPLPLPLPLVAALLAPAHTYIHLITSRYGVAAISILDSLYRQASAIDNASPE